MTSISMEDDMDLSMRAPYISMSEADDLPLLISEDLMWGALPCDAPKFMHEPKLNGIVDVQTMQVASHPQLALASVKAGDFLLSNSNLNNSHSAASLATTIARDTVNPSRRRKATGLLSEDEDEVEELVDRNETGQERSAKPGLLLQVGGINGQMTAVGNNNNNSSSSCSTSSSSEDTNHSDCIEPMFDESLAKNCELVGGV